MRDFVDEYEATGEPNLSTIAGCANARYTAAPELLAYRHLIKHALSRGMAISVYDGECWSVKRSTNQREIFTDITAVEEAIIKIRQGDTVIAKAVIIPFGVKPEETVADHNECAFMTEWETAYMESAK